MSESIVLWTSANGTNLPNSLKTCNEIMRFNSVLKNAEVLKIQKAFEAQLYDMSVEYTWSRTMGIIRKKIASFGEIFIAEMLGRASENNFGIESVSENDLINLATDLGIINTTAQLEFQHISKVLQHYLSAEVKDELDEIDALKYLKNCVKYILSIDNQDFSISFAHFRDSLKNNFLSNESDELNYLKISPYFYKRTAMRTLISLAKTTQDAELEKVLANIQIITPQIWEGLLSDDKYSLGFAYSESVNKGDKKLSSGFKSTLLKVKGFDYVPENLRSNTFINAANSLIDSHFQMNNFYNEPEKARLLYSLGTSIPAPALGPCITASIISKIGNSYGVSHDAQQYLDNIFKSVSQGKWEYYFNKCFEGEERILFKLFDNSVCKRWCNFVQNHLPEKMYLTSSKVSDLIDNSFKEKTSLIDLNVRYLLKNIRG